MPAPPIVLLALQEGGDRAARWDRAAVLIGLLVFIVVARELVTASIHRRRDRAADRRRGVDGTGGADRAKGDGR